MNYVTFSTLHQYMFYSFTIITSVTGLVCLVSFDVFNLTELLLLVWIFRFPRYSMDRDKDENTKSNLQLMCDLVTKTTIANYTTV